MLKYSLLRSSIVLEEDFNDISDQDSAEILGLKGLGWSGDFSYRQYLLYKTMSSLEGRNSLAKMMVEPLMGSLSYAEIGRKLFTVEELPQAAYARYQR